MKKIYLIIILKLFLINLLSAKEELVELRFYFSPSFIPVSEFVFNFENQIEELELIIEIPFFKLQELNFEKLEDDSSRYIPVISSQFLDFGNRLCAIEFDSIKRKPHRFYDGISIEITKKFNTGKEEKLYFDSPSIGEYKIEYEILDDFFELIEKLGLKGNQRNYVERLKNYFDYGLPIKQTNSEPLEFRFWGSITSNHKTELKTFFRSLPPNQKIIFDLRNSGEMGTMFYKYFRRENRKKEIYYLLEGEDSHTVQGIGNCRVIN